MVRLILLLTLSSIKIVAQGQHVSIPVGRIANHMFFGKQHGPIFEPGFKAYEPKKEAIQRLKAQKKKLSFKCVLGFWCEDSKIHVPAFLKIMDAMGMGEEGYRMYGVDENKQAAFEGFNALRIEFVPTIIVYFEGAEIGRWVETPNESIEEDLLRIVERHLNP